MPWPGVCKMAKIAVWLKCANDLGDVEGLYIPRTRRIATVFTRFQMTLGPEACAVSGSGAYATSKGDAPDQAKANALAACAQFAAKDSESFLITVTCRVIA